ARQSTLAERCCRGGAALRGFHRLAGDHQRDEDREEDEEQPAVYPSADQRGEKCDEPPEADGALPLREALDLGAMSREALVVHHQNSGICTCFGGTGGRA